MALALNTGHALYGNLLALICVDDDNTIKDLRGNQTCTKDAACTIQSTGAYGRAFRTIFEGGNAKGVSLSPGIALGTGAKSVFIVTNSINSLEGSRYMAINIMAGGWSPSVSAAYYPRLYSVENYDALTGSAAINTGGHSWGACADRTGNLTKTFADGSTIATGVANNSGYGSSTLQSYIGGEVSGGYGGIGADYVWIAFFDKYLTDAEISALHASLGANNAFGLVESAAGSNGTATGTPDTLDLIAPTATGNGTGSGTTNGSASGTPSSASLSAPSATGTGTTAGNGTITTPALKNNTGTVLASISGWTVNVYNASTGALVVQKTGLATNASGILTITDAAIVSGTSYTYEPVHATYGRRLPTGTAS